VDLEHHPELLQRPDFAARAAGWFWKSHGLNELADKARTYEDFDKISNVINRGDPAKPSLHQKERRDAWDYAKKGLKVDGQPAPAKANPPANPNTPMT
jgi:putative chitinase